MVMQHEFADQIILKVEKSAQEITEAEAYLIQAIVGEWERMHSRSVNSSFGGNKRLERHVQDKFNTDARMGSRMFRRFLMFMSRDIRNITPWGMLSENLS